MTMVDPMALTRVSNQSAPITLWRRLSQPESGLRSHYGSIADRRVTAAKAWCLPSTRQRRDIHSKPSGRRRWPLPTERCYLQARYSSLSNAKVVGIGEQQYEYSIPPKAVHIWHCACALAFLIHFCLEGLELNRYTVISEDMQACSG